MRLGEFLFIYVRKMRVYNKTGGKGEGRLLPWGGKEGVDAFVIGI